jgi:hypothetical protein
MKRVLLSSMLAAIALSAVRADSLDLALVAAMKLPDAANYSWLTTVDDDARSYTIDGQTDRATDLSLVSMPVVAAIRRRAGTGSSNSGNLSTVAFKGDEHFVIQTDDGWKTAGELAAQATSRSRGGSSRYPGMGGARSRHGRNARRGGFPGGAGAGDAEGGRPLPPYSNLQKTLSRPHEEVGFIVAGAGDLKAEGDIVSGTLSETAAKLLLVHPGQKEITPLTGSGTFRLWIRDGVLTRYEVKLEGMLAVQGNGERHEVAVHQTALTEIRQVGTTKVAVPDEAKKKLGA